MAENNKKIELEMLNAENSSFEECTASKETSNVQNKNDKHRFNASGTPSDKYFFMLEKLIFQSFVPYISRYSFFKKIYSKIIVNAICESGRIFLFISVL